MSSKNSKPPPAGKKSPPDAPAATPEPPAKGTGRVKFDDRGNAVWEWALISGEFGSEGTTARIKKLENPYLAIAEDAPVPAKTIMTNPLGTVKGYDPYESGKLDGKPKPRKKDLKKLSEWIASAQAGGGQQGRPVMGFSPRRGASSP